jgi:hypothetical protein
MRRHQDIASLSRPKGTRPLRLNSRSYCDSLHLVLAGEDFDHQDTQARWFLGLRVLVSFVVELLACLCQVP